jgi:erythromycin esterase
MTKALMIALLACLAATLPACTDDLAAERKAVEAQYARLDVALNGKDPSPFEGLATPDFRFVSVDGDELDLDLSARLWRQEMAMYEALAVRSEVQSVAAKGDAAHVVVRVVREGKGKKGSLVGKVRAEDTLHDTWERLGSEWRLRLSTVVHSKGWDDGVLTWDVAAARLLDPARRDAIVGDLRARAIPFNAVTAGAGFDDLAALDRIIGDARIVALGEATHGTAEFFRMKHRLFEYLVEKKGFTVLAFEDAWPDLEIVDRYVKTGGGAAADALKAMQHSIWKTREVRDLIEWMRTYNSVPGRAKMLSFTGFDMQGSAAAAFRCVVDALNKLDASEGKAILRLYAPRSNAEKAKADAVEALKLVEARREALLRVMSPAEYRRVRQCGAVIVQFWQLTVAEATGPINEYSNIRDKAMAANVKWLVEEAFPSEKIVLWAHNGHVAAAPGSKAEVPMGQHLRRMFGEQMRILGFAFDRGEVGYRGRDRGHDPSRATLVKVPAASPNSAEAVLRAAGLPRFILDLRTVPAAGPLGDWIAEPQMLRSIGGPALVEEHLDDPVSAYLMLSQYDIWLLPKAFDALVFIEESTATVPLK